MTNTTYHTTRRTTVVTFRDKKGRTDSRKPTFSVIGTPSADDTQKYVLVDGVMPLRFANALRAAFKAMTNG